MIAKLIIILCCAGIINAKLITNKSEIDYSLSVIQIASVKILKSINQIKKQINPKLDIVIKEGKYYSIYVVNIQNKDKKKVFNNLQVKFKDILFVNLKNDNLLYVPSIKKTRVIKENTGVEKIIQIKAIDMNTKKIQKNYKVTNDNEVGKSFFNAKNYKVSYEIFNSLFKNNLESKEINFYLAQSAFKLKKYDEAYSAYERILIDNPNDIRAKLEIARISFIQKKYEDAKRIFLELKKKNLPVNVRAKIKRYLEDIREKINKHLFDSFYTVGVGYDSNINNRANDEIFYIPKLSVNFSNDTKDESSISLNTSYSISHKYLFSSDMTLKNDVLFYLKKVLKDDKKDVAFMSYSPGINIHYKNYLIQYSLYVDFLRFENVYYLSSYGISPRYTYMFKDNMNFDISLRYLKKSHQFEKNKDSTYLKASVGLLKLYNNYLFNQSIFIESENNDKTQLSNVNYSLFGLRSLVNYTYSKNLSLIPSFMYKSKKYSDIDVNYLVKQKNTEYTFTLNSFYLLDKQWSNSISISYSDVKSNIASASYKKNNIAVNFIKKF